ncbi:MAG: hypothetical protein WC145_02235 [Aliarcobacter sp.]
MNIKTKFDPEDFVYGLHREEIVKAKILKIQITATFEKNIFNYNIKLEGRKTPLWVDESELYSSVDSLIDDMKNKFIEKQVKNEHIDS